MNREQIRVKLLDILGLPQFASLHVDASSISDDTSLLNDVGMDSLQILSLIVEMENTFGFKIGNGSVRLDTFDRFDRVINLVDETQGLSQQ